MRYMGFGMNKEVYSRKPKKPYAYLKSLYGEQLDKHFNISHQTVIKETQLSKVEWRNFRKMVKDRVQRENRQRWWKALVSVFLTIAVLFSLVWLVREWFGI